MTWIQTMLLSTLLALSAYLLIQTQQLATQLQQLSTNQTKSNELQTASLEPLQKNITTIQTALGKLGTDAEQKQQALIKKAEQKTDAALLLSKVNRAETLLLSGKATEAAELLKTTKKGIWQLGDNLPEAKASLQGLMPTIDNVATAWSADKKEASPAPIRTALEAVLGGEKK